MASGGAHARNRPLKGRRKFMADLKDATDACATGFEVHGLRLQTIETGEDEGSILCEVVKSVGGQHVLTLNMVVPDTSEYPNDHSFICFAQDQNVPPPLLEVLQDASDLGSRSIQDMLSKILASLSKKLVPNVGSSSPEGDLTDGSDVADDDSVDEGHFEDDDFNQYGLAAIKAGSDFDASVLQHDFSGIVAVGGRPGLTRIGVSELVLSVSAPTFRLAESVAPRALMAWDPRLLSKSHHFTLVITGIHGKYPVLSPEGTLSSDALARGTSKLVFRVGLTPNYKPDREQVLDLVRTFGMQESQPTEEITSEMYDGQEPTESPDLLGEPVPEDDDSFHFSLSTSLEALLNDRFMEVLALRAKYSIGWAAAETIVSRVHRLQRTVEKVLEDFPEEILAADHEENMLTDSYRLPLDPLIASGRSGPLNLPLIAYCYLLRRLILCSRFCLVCYDKIETDFQALKPYVCSDKLCTYQFYNLNRGPSLEYEICSRPATVDLLVSLAYVAAAENALEDFPDGMHLRVPQVGAHPTPGALAGMLCDFDTLSAADKRRWIVWLLDALPAVSDMRRHLLKKTKRGRMKQCLQDLDPEVLPAAWSVLRWCVASCTAHLEELREEEDQVTGGFDHQYRHFRFTVGAPDAEAKFYRAQEQAKLQDANAQRYPSIYGFHGSPAKNWHSIIRNGLWYKDVAHGRAYGDGVYFALDGTTSNGYARGASHAWSKSDLHVRTCVALAEIVNLPSQFPGHTGILVVPQTEWIVCRYLLVGGVPLQTDTDGPLLPEVRHAQEVPRVDLDPRFQLRFANKDVGIPEPTHKLARLLQQRMHEHADEGFDEGDLAVLAGASLDVPSHAHDIEENQANQERQESVSRPEDDWTHDPAWVASCVEHLMPAPVEASPMAASAVQREMAAMLKEQERARCLRELGWYMPEDFIGDNLFQWIVELHSFEPSLPVAQDMAARQVNSLVFEIRFPPNFPHSPPFFRILKPRFLPFIQGGGGHVTGGGSMCMDLLTADGWSPAYSISAVLLQIRLAISNLDPRPARLASNWDRPYEMREAIEGYRRAAAAHGWKVPETVNGLR
ncbi:uncharacterized protein PHACADRAFT_151428 [Phanerochaete carnosa HHB-10118-sp]|uniref:UBC core domain-containing protein n=1 Tax=Phanerochaete carnosa (strain HHB-10118-sp) TaxID=650164 RepID=K5VW05_PHACS|nr:uncharacterized protein PHACADRAFT_151428 [Phanerochaete carnosa HHB-10118-sp]EKM50995.1 hypothetical protein PHACADRAFT_151428 [Phanerochaete carnosa HHB-10118-sp]